jgi:hypothetical protein
MMYSYDVRPGSGCIVDLPQEQSLMDGDRDIVYGIEYQPAFTKSKSQNQSIIELSERRGDW